MRKTNMELLNKNAFTIIYLAKLFIQMDIDDKLPTFDELSKLIGVARGTVQNSLKVLLDANAIEVLARGHMGTFLTKKDMKILIQLADIRTILGSMSLPYSKVYEGLASGVVASLNNEYDVAIHMVYMRDAIDRLDAMLLGRYDFTLLSKSSAEFAIQNNKDIEIVAEFGPKSYLSAQVMVFSSNSMTEVKDGMKVGLAKNAKSQNRWASVISEGKNVEFVTFDYSQVLPALKKKQIDVTAWNKDEINDALIKMNTVPIVQVNELNTTAVLVVDKNRPEMKKILQEIIDVEKVKEIQHLVISEEISPKY